MMASVFLIVASALSLVALLYSARMSSLSPELLQSAQGNKDTCNTNDAENQIRQIFRRNQTREITFRMIGGPAPSFWDAC